jgi:hypothetical protein
VNHALPVLTLASLPTDLYILPQIPHNSINLDGSCFVSAAIYRHCCICHYRKDAPGQIYQTLPDIIPVLHGFKRSPHQARLSTTHKNIKADHRPDNVANQQLLF